MSNTSAKKGKISLKEGSHVSANRHLGLLALALLTRKGNITTNPENMV